jgi:hypothetical protein
VWTLDATTLFIVFKGDEDAVSFTRSGRQVETLNQLRKSANKDISMNRGQRRKVFDIHLTNASELVAL